jgi:hypothetical protein
LGLQELLVRLLLSLSESEQALGRLALHALFLSARAFEHRVQEFHFILVERAELVLESVRFFEGFLLGGFEGLIYVIS